MKMKYNFFGLTQVKLSTNTNFRVFLDELDVLPLGLFPELKIKNNCSVDFRDYLGFPKLFIEFNIKKS